MNKIDYNLLFLVCENARIRLKDAAKELGKSPQRLNYSLESLSKNNILTIPYALVDYSFFQLLLFKVYYKGGYLTTEEKKQLAKKIEENTYVVGIYSLDGEFDLCVEVLAPNPSRFNKVLTAIRTLLASMPDHKITLNVVSHLYPRLSLLKNPALGASYPQEYIIGGDRPYKAASYEELSVLKAISEYPVKPKTMLAKIAGMHLSTFKKHLKSLQDEKILRGFRYAINIPELGMERARLFVSLQTMTDEEREALLAYFREKKYIVMASWTVGDWNLELDIETKDNRQLRNAILDFRQKFRNIIRNFLVAEVTESYKRKYLPEYLFAEHK